MDKDKVTRRTAEPVNEEDETREGPIQDVTDEPEMTTGGTGTLPEGGVPNPGLTARGD
jgi:hypothetical protein